MARIGDVLDALYLKKVDAYYANSAVSDTFLAEKNLNIPTNRTYGGQLLAQSMVAASLTTSGYRLPNSLHAYFILPGALDKQILYHVERLRDGAAYSHREVTATQTDASGKRRNIFKSQLSFHEPEKLNIAFAAPEFPQVPAPESTTSFEDMFKADIGKDAWTEYFRFQMPFEIRQISQNLFFGRDQKALDGIRSPELVWFRVRPEEAHLLAENMHLKRQLLQRVLLTFFCDQFAFAPALRQSTLSWTIPGAAYASLDHAMWFHEDIDLLDWNLLYGTSPNAADARGLGVSYIFNQKHKVVATVAQEGMLRANLPSS
ncbi:MAG: thioesterase family protein [Candidatus Ancillula sp.]|jgi:acyl-CoA thioesterase-2|nr:thioesterase family protein [Candidatus Ancillula sp.]